jgi:hypothetical protein
MDHTAVSFFVFAPLGCGTRPVDMATTLAIRSPHSSNRDKRGGRDVSTARMVNRLNDATDFTDSTDEAWIQVSSVLSALSVVSSLPKSS